MKSQAKNTSNSANENDGSQKEFKSSFSKNGTAKSGKQNIRTSKKKSSKAEKTLDDLFEEGLKDIYNAETQLVKALPEMVKAAENEELADIFRTHLQQTERQIERLEKIFDRLDIDKNDKETCEAMKGLIEESKQVIKEFEESPVRDSALIIGAQKVEHYEIASYGSLRELADVLGYYKIAELLDRTLEEEEKTDKILSSIAQEINDEACELTKNEEHEMV